MLAGPQRSFQLVDNLRWGCMPKELLVIGGVLFLAGVAHFTLAFLALAQSGNRNPARPWMGLLALSTGIMCATMTISYLLNYLGKDYDFVYRLTWQGYLEAALIYKIVLLHYAHVEKWRIYLNRFMFIFWAAVFAVVMTTDLIARQPISLFPYIRFDTPFEIPIRLIGDLNMTWLFYEILRARKNLIAVRRHKSDFFLLGLSTYLIGALFSAGGIQNITGLPLDPGLVGLFSLPWIGLTYYAVTRHRLFNIRMAIARILSIVVVSVAAAGLALLINQYLQKFLSGPVSFFIAALIATMLTVGGQIFRITNALVRGLLVRDTYDFQEMLKRSSEMTVSLFNVDELLRRFVKLTRENLETSVAHFFVSPKGSSGDYVLQASLGGAEVSSFESPGKKKLIEWLSKSRQTFIKEEQELQNESSGFAEISNFLNSLQGEVVVPAFHQESLIGFLVLGSKRSQDAFSVEDIRLLETMITQIALSIQNARLFEEATTDGLTGLYHQKYFKTRLKNEYLAAVRHHRNLGVLMIDADHFKKINDNHGHLAGDSVLKELARNLQLAFRAEDLVARYGGEEFIVLLIEPNPQQIYEVAERFRKKVEEFSFSAKVSVTVSVGAYFFSPDQFCSSEQDLLERADKAVYEAKHSGRNRVVVYRHEQHKDTSKVVIPFEVPSKIKRA